MARGWESKSVQEQIESAKARGGEPTVRLTPEEVIRKAKQDSLLLQRTRVMRDLENCREPKYRTTLAAGLAYLEDQLTKLGWRST